MRAGAAGQGSPGDVLLDAVEAALGAVAADVGEVEGERPRLRGAVGLGDGDVLHGERVSLGGHRLGQHAILAHPWRYVNAPPWSPSVTDQPVPTAGLLVGPGRGCGLPYLQQWHCGLRSTIPQHTAGGRGPLQPGQTGLETTRKAELGQGGWVRSGLARSAETPWHTHPLLPLHLLQARATLHLGVWEEGRHTGTGLEGLTGGQHLPPPTTTRAAHTWFT